jgi:hypothetical protein
MGKVSFYGSRYGMYDFFPLFWTITMSVFLRFAWEVDFIFGAFIYGSGA